MIEEHPTTLKFTSTGPGPLVLIILSFVLLCWGVFLTNLGSKVGWLVIACAVVFVLALPLLKSKSASTLTMAFRGFSVNHAGYTCSFMWSDVEAFVTCGNRGNRYVAFTLSPSGKKRCSTRNSFLSMAEPGGFGDEMHFPEHYGLGAEQLRALLNEWQIRGSRSREKSQR